ncbi:hypothetical protein C0389_04590 [bacterium]|nr:hypothetical protein [bacterium]
MLPIKSISGIIGIGENVEYSEYSCNDCGIKKLHLQNNKYTSESSSFFKTSNSLIDVKLSENICSS